MIRYAVKDINDIKWFNEPPENWHEQKRFIPETIQKLRDAKKLFEFLLDHSITTEDDDVIVDMESVYEELRHNSDEVLEMYLPGKEK